MTPLHPLDDVTVASLLVTTQPWLDCDDCFEKLDTYADAVVRDPTHGDPAMVTHLAGCPACREEADSLVALLNTLETEGEASR